MQTVETIVEVARRRVLAHRILSGPALKEYFNSQMALHPEVHMEVLQQEAVTRGLYRYLGERYLLALNFTLACAAAAIISDLIRSEQDLIHFIQRASISLAPFGHCGKVNKDLMIDARQRGFYRLIESRSSLPV